MKKFYMFGLSVLLGTWLVLQGCTKDMPDLPSGPAVGLGTPTPTVTFTPLATVMPQGVDPGLFCLAYVQDGVGYGLVSVNNANEPSAGINITTPSGDVPLTFLSDYYTYHSDFQNAIVYQPGGIYTIAVTTSIGTATSTLAAPNGTISIAPDGSSASWTAEGSNDTVVVRNSAVTNFNHITYNSAVFTSDLASPFVVPAEAYPVPGTYTIEVLNANMTFNFPGAIQRSAFTVGKSQAITVLK